MRERLIDVMCDNTSKTNCVVKLGAVFCDGYWEQQRIGAFSHFHADHIRSIENCIAEYDHMIAHPITFRGLCALKPGLRFREQWVTQDYDTMFTFSGGSVRLLKANHIPGSSQIHVDYGGHTLLYSGDFSYPDVQTRHADYLVIDATHGDPWHDGKTDRGSVKNRMFEYIKDVLETKHRIVVHTSTGTLQELTKHFETGCDQRLADDVVFVMDHKQEKVLRSIYHDEFSEFRPIVPYATPEFGTVLRTNKKCVIFLTHKILDDELRKFHRIAVDAYRFEKGTSPIIPFDGGCRFNLAAHASIDDIYQYIDEIDPKHVVTDGSRSAYAGQLAKLIEQKFPQIKAESRP